MNEWKLHMHYVVHQRSADWFERQLARDEDFAPLVPWPRMFLSERLAISSARARLAEWHRVRQAGREVRR